MSGFVSINDPNNIDRALAVNADGSINVTDTPISSSTGTTTQVTATTGTAPAGTLLAANSSRKGAILVNPGPTTVYIGFTNAVTTATGLPLYGGSSLVIDDPLYTGGIFGVAASGTQVIGAGEFT